MASCLVPDFPVVMVVLEHIKELDKQLKEDGIQFSPEASLHLTEITAAITDLEADRRATHEHLEVATIENSKLRHQINNMSERMTQDIMADITAARASNAQEIDQLLKDLMAVSQLQEATVKRQEALLSQNKALEPERAQVKAEYEEIVATLNEQITIKYALQMQLEQTEDHIEELNSTTVTVEQDKIALQQNMVLEREAFSVKQEILSREIAEIERKIEQQKQSISMRRKELDSVNNKKLEIYDRLGELTVDIAELESNVRRLTASRCQCEKKLQGEIQNNNELRQQREILKWELCELEEAFSVDVQRLKEEIATVEGKMEKGQASRLLCQDALAQICNLYKHQHDEESEVRAELFHVSQQLERSKLQLEERIASIVKHRKEIKEMDKQIAELLETDTINKRVFERDQEEVCDNMDTENRNISHFREEKMRLTILLEESKREQEEYKAKMTSDISSTRRRYQELQQEEVALIQRQSKSVDPDTLMSHVTQCEVEYRQKEIEYHQEIEQSTAEAEVIMKSNEVKQRELEEKEERLKEVEAMWNEKQSRHQKLKQLTSELRKKRCDLERSIQDLKKKTISQLEPREEMKAELEAMRESYMAQLREQASELRATEMSIYDSKVKLEQVSMENSRMHLCIKQMTEGFSRAREDKMRYWQEIHQLKQDTKALFESLQEAWEEDTMVTQHCQNNDGVLLVSMSAMLSCLKTKKQELENVSTNLHKLMLDFSRRLGDKATVEQHS